MNLKELANFNQPNRSETIPKSLEDLDELDRLSPTEEAYLKGVDLLNQACQDGNVNKTKLEAAFKVFAEIKKAEPQNPDPYVPLAYIYSLMNNRLQADTHLKIALELAPEHPEALELQAALLASAQGEPTQEPEPAPSDWLGSLDYELERELAEEDEKEYLASLAALPLEFDPLDPGALELTKNYDLDDLYDGIENLIQNQVRSLMDTMAQAKATPESAQELYYQQIFLMLQQKVLNFHIEAVEQEIDTQDLKHKMLPLQALLRRVLKNAQASEQMLVQEQQIAWSAGAVVTLSRLLDKVKSRQEHQLIETALERLMDEIDRTADSLDELDSQKHNIRALEHAYNKVVAAIEGLHDALDDKLESLPT